MKSLFEQQADELAKLNELAKRKSQPTSLFAILGVSIGAFIFMCLCSAYGVFVHGFVGHYLWAWFIVPVFNLPALSTLQAAGIMFIIRLFTYENPFGMSESMKGKTPTEITAKAFAVLIIPWVSLLIGYVVHRLM